MSWKISGACWDLDLPANKLLVLLALADHADHEGNNIYPSIALVAWKTGYSVNQTRRVMHALTEDGILVTVSKTPGRVTKYRIDLSKGTPKPARKPDTPPKMGVHPSQNGSSTPPIAMSDEPSLEPINKPLAPNGESPSKAKAKKPTTPKERDALFDAVAQHVWNTDPAQITASGGRIGAITAWLSGKSDGMKRGKGRVEVGYISSPARPEHVAAFMKWFGVAHPGITLRDFEKFVEYWREWASAANARRAVRPTPAIPEETEAERATRLEQLQAVRREIHGDTQS